MKTTPPDYSEIENFLKDYDYGDGMIKSWMKHIVHGKI
jgi:hypothetical protein